MLEPISKNAKLFTETDVALAQKFREAGFGMHKDGELLLSPLEACYLAKIGKAKFTQQPRCGSRSLQSAEEHLGAASPSATQAQAFRPGLLTQGTLVSNIAAQKKHDKIFPFALSVYFLIRQTGRMVAPFEKTTQYFRAYAPGVGRMENRPSQLIYLLPGKSPSSKQLVEQVKIAHLSRLELIIACGDEKEPHFYKLSAFNF